MTKQEYENAVITNCKWNYAAWGDYGYLTMDINGKHRQYSLIELIIPLGILGLIDGVKDEMFEIKKIHAQEWTVFESGTQNTCLVDIDTFMFHYVDMAFCEKILKYL